MIQSFHFEGSPQNVKVEHYKHLLILDQQYERALLYRALYSPQAETNIVL